jgi:hypothetical protein
MNELIRSGIHLLGHGLERAAQAVTSMVVLFTFGAVLLALLGPRMERLELEVAARPARTFALGVVGFCVGVALLAFLCITLVGIPFAIIGLLCSVVAISAGIAAGLTVLGKALAGHRTANRYLHLALGCAIYLVLGNIPWLRELVDFVVISFGLGSLIASRAAGFWVQRSSPAYAT